MIYWCGGEDIDFPSGTRPTINTTTGYFRTNYARHALQGGMGYSKTFPMIKRGWLHFYGGTNNNAGTTYIYVGVTSETSSDGLWFGLGAWSYQYIYKRVGGTFNSLANRATNMTGYRTFDLYFNYSENGVVRLHVNGENSSLISFSGNNLISGIEGFTRVGIFTHTSSGYGEASEIIVSDTDTRAMSLKLLHPNASGDLNEFTGNYTEIDEQTINDNDFMVGTDPDLTSRVHLAGVGSLPGVPKAIKLVSRSSTSNDALDLRMGLTSNGSTYLGDPLGLTGNFTTYEEILHFNPLTNKVFTAAELDDMQLTFKTVSR